MIGQVFQAIITNGLHTLVVRANRSPVGVDDGYGGSAEIIFPPDAEVLINSQRVFKMSRESTRISVHIGNGYTWYVTDSYR